MGGHRQGFGRYKVDLDAYERRVRTGSCFVCGIVARDPNTPSHHIVYEDGKTIAFFNRYPTLYGYTLVAPKDHKEQATGDFTEGEYVDFQRTVHRISEAVRQEVGAERVYLLSLGSQQGNAHVHWHVAPLPPGVPYREQQFAALMLEEKGALDIPEAEKATLAARIRHRVERMESLEKDTSGRRKNAPHPEEDG